MHKFYFNECLAECDNLQIFKDFFSNALTHFITLKDNEDLNVEKAIVTEKLPSNIVFGQNNFTLSDVINGLTDKTLKRIAFALFNKYPIGSYFELTDESVETLLSKNYYLTINNNNLDALNLAIVYYNKGFLFSVPLHNDLKKHFLVLKSKNEKNNELSIDNLYGEEANTKIIKDKLLTLELIHLSNLEKLKYTLGAFVFSNNFEKEFLKLNLTEQNSIIDTFEKAKNRGLLSPFYPDTKIIKDVSPEKANCNVYELRVYAPTALRVYFNESVEKIFLSTIEKKSNPNQNEDIKKAHSILYKMILTG